MYVLGLTGSIGMGKSTTAQMFKEAGIPVYDADATVHRLYEGRAAPLVEAEFPGTVIDGVVDRKELGNRVIGKPEALKRLEAIVHPLVRQEQDAFLNEQRAIGTEFVILDIPLLFETGGRDRVDGIIVVTTNPEEQRRRVLARPGMTVEIFEAILAKQLPDEEKRKQADFIVDTTEGMESAKRQVDEIIASIHQKKWNPSPRS